MKVKILCDRCFNDVMTNKTLYKYGSAVYCKDCHAEIEKEFFEELLKEYLKGKYVDKNRQLELEITNHSFLRKEA